MSQPAPHWLWSVSHRFGEEHHPGRHVRTGPLGNRPPAVSFRRSRRHGSDGRSPMPAAPTVPCPPRCPSRQGAPTPESVRRAGRRLVTTRPAAASTGWTLRDSAALAAVVGVVNQETYLLHTSVRENLRYARPDATDADIEDAARAAQLLDLITSLPDGYDTTVGLPPAPSSPAAQKQGASRSPAPLLPAQLQRRGSVRGGSSNPATTGSYDTGSSAQQHLGRSHPANRFRQAAPVTITSPPRLTPPASKTTTRTAGRPAAQTIGGSSRVNAPPSLRGA